MNFDRMRALLLDQAIRGELVPQLVGEGVVAQIGTSLEEVPFEIPESWKWVPFSSIATLLNGRAYKKTELLEEPTSNGKDNTPILRVGNLFTSDKWYYSDLTLEDDKYCNPGDLLYAWSASFGPTIWQGCRSIYHYHIWRVDHNSSYVNKKWLYFWLLGKTQDLKRSGHGLAMIHITKKGMEQELVALPPLQEQVRIVAKLEEAFAEIDRAEKAYEELQTLAGVLRGQILQEAIQGKLVPQMAEEGVVEQFGAAPKEVPFTIPESWKWCYMKGITKKIHYGFTASAANAGNAKLLRITDIQDGRVNWDTVPFCDVPEKKLASCKLGESDVVIARTGGTIGKSFLLTDVSDVAVFASYLIRLIPCAEVVNPRYLMVFLNSQEYWKQLKAMSQGTGQPNVNAKSLSTLLLPLPPLDEQARIVAKVEELLKHVDALSAK